MSFPDYEEVSQFRSTVALPALDEVSEELGERGVKADVYDGMDELGLRYVEPTAELGGEAPFSNDSLRAWSHSRNGDRVLRSENFSYRVEVHLREGGQNYDVMGYSQSQLIEDVLDQYDQHLELVRINPQATR